MMFSCHPRLPEAAQVALISHPLRLHRRRGRGGLRRKPRRHREADRAGQEGSRRLKKLFDVTAADLARRLPAVRRALYLLFNEGYHGASAESAVRAELCREAIRLSHVLLEHPAGKAPANYALAALMCLHGARLASRVDEAGNLTPLPDQDRSRWDHGLIREGLRLLEISAEGGEATEYHIEAAIAAIHARTKRAEDTDWKMIVSLYGALMAIHPSPVVALNRAIAVAQSEGPERGLEEIGAIDGRERLASYPFYPAAIGERSFAWAAQYRAERLLALALARNPTSGGSSRAVSACEGDVRYVPNRK